MMLGELIAALEACDPETKVPIGFGHPHSYRGYYTDLAFEPVRDTTIGAMLAAAKEALGRVYQGYKGGDYLMGEYNDCWLSEYGTTGEGLGPVLLAYMTGRIELVKIGEERWR